MQQIGPNSLPCLELAQRLIEDFVIFQKTCCDQLKSLPKVAPRFAVNFMTSVSDLYFKEINGDIATPPETLIELFTEWISEDPTLCSEAQPPLDLLPGSIPMALIPPIEGLIRWCALSPLYLSITELSYSKLHLSLLQSLTQSAQKNASPPPTPINAQSLNTIIDSVRNEAERNRAKGLDSNKDERMQVCLERFAQAIQLGIIAKIIIGGIPQLLCRLETLPQSQLMQMVIRSQKANYL